MSLPYRIVLIVGLSMAVMFGRAPWLTMRAISNAAAANDTDSWSGLVNQQDMQTFAGEMLHALLDLKLQADVKQNPSDALRDNLQGKFEVNANAQKLTEPKGLARLLCGELQGEVAPKPTETGCWSLDGDIHWESPQRVRVVFIHPDIHWQSSLILIRTGLFSWRADAIELPAEAILDRFASSVGLKASTGTSAASASVDG